MGRAGTKFITRLAQLRIDSGLRMREITEITGIPSSTLSAWESGTTSSIRGASWGVAIKLGDLYGVSANDISDMIKESYEHRHHSEVVGEFTEIPLKPVEVSVDVNVDMPVDVIEPTIAPLPMPSECESADGLLERIYGKVDMRDFMTIAKLLEVRNGEF